MHAILWQGTVDNLDLQGLINGDVCPMRIVENADGRLMTEFAENTLGADGAVAYGAGWYPDVRSRFRDMLPPLSEDLQARMIAQGLLDA